MRKGEGEYDLNDRFVTAFRKWWKYDDAWVKSYEELGYVLEEHDVKNPPTGFDTDGFQHGEGV